MVAYRGATSAHSGTGNASTLDLSLAAAGAQVGDLAIVVGAWNRASAVLTIAGWAAGDAQDVSTTLSARTFRKVLEAGDIAADTVTVTATDSGKASVAMVVVSSPGTVEGPTLAQDAANDTTQALGGIDPTASSLVVAMMGINYNAAGLSASPPAGWTERTDTITTNGSGRKSGAWAGTFDTISDAAVAASIVTTNDAAHATSWVFAVNQVAASTPSGGSVSTATVTTQGGGLKVAQGSATATATASELGGGTTVRQGGSIVPAAATAFGVGSKAGRGGSILVVTVATAGAGHRIDQGHGGSVFAVTATALGSGSKVASGGAVTITTATATSGGHKRQGSPTMAITPDVEFVTLAGVIGAMIGDTAGDPDKNPNAVPATEGTVTITPAIESVHVTDSVTGKTIPLVPFPIVCTIDAQGRITYNGDPSVTLVDLGSDKVNPSIPRDKAAYTVSFKAVKMDGATVTMKSFGINPSPADVGTDGLINLFDLQPLAPGGAGAGIVRGLGVPPVTTATSGQVVTYDGAEIKWTDPETASDEGVAGYITTPGTATATALSDTIGATTASARTVSHEIRKHAVRKAKGGRIGTGGKGVVAWRVDHMLDEYRATTWPILRDRGMPAGVGIVTDAVGNATHVADPTATTWDEVRTMMWEGSEIWSHSATHLAPLPLGSGTGAPLGETVDAEIIGSRATLEANDINVMGWQTPGIVGCLTPAYSANFTDLADFETETGQKYLATYGLVEHGQQIHGGQPRYLPSDGVYGYAHTITLESSSLTQAKGWVDEAAALGVGVELMFHPRYIGQTDMMSVADFTALADYVKGKWDAGEIEVLTPSGLAFADPGTSHRLQLLRDTSFEGVGTSAAAIGAWTIRNNDTGVTLMTDGGHTGSNYVRFSLGTLNYIEQGYTKVVPGGIAGAAFLAEAWVRNQSALDSTARVQVLDNGGGTPTFMRDIRVPLTAGQDWTRVRVPFVIPTTCLNLVTRVSRWVTGDGDVDFDDITVRAI